MHPDFRRHVLASFVYAAAGPLALGAAAMWSPSPVSVWFVLLMGVCTFGAAYYGFVVAPRWYRWASDIVASARPTNGHIVLHRYIDSDFMALYASEAMSRKGTTADRFRVLIPRWRYEPFLDARLEAKTYRDPQTHQPVAFQTASGWLWCCPAPRRRSRETARSV